MPSPRRPRRTGALPQARAAAVRSAEAEISSLQSSLSDITRRIGSLVEGLLASGDEDHWGDLLSVQRSLETAARRLARIAGR